MKSPVSVAICRSCSINRSNTRFKTSVLCPAFYLDSVTQETHMAVTRRVQSLEESESKLKVEVSRLKEVAEVASHQTEAIKAQQESQDRELTSLRKQLYDMQMESDDKTIIGQCV